jgi:hypothetical protein
MMGGVYIPIFHQNTIYTIYFGFVMRYLLSTHYLHQYLLTIYTPAASAMGV